MKRKMKKKYSIGHNVLFCSLLVFVFFSLKSYSQNTILSKGDSLKINECFKLGVKAARLGDFEEAVRNFNSVISVQQAIWGERSLKLVTPLNNVGIQYKNLGDYDRAKNIYLKAESIINYNEGNESSRLAPVYSNLGTIFKIKGDYLKCFEYQRNALSLYQRNIQDGIYAVKTTYSVAEALYLLKKYDEATKLCFDNYLKVPLDVKAYYTSLLATTYAAQGNITQAKKYYNETFELQKKTGGINSYDLGLEYTDYVKFLLSIKEFNEIQRYNEESEKIISQYFTTHSTQYAGVMLNYGDYYSQRYSAARFLSDFNLKKQEDLLLALKYYQKAIVAATSNFNKANLHENPHADSAISELLLLEIMKKKSACMAALADLKLNMNKQADARVYYLSALDAVEVAIELVHRIRTGFETEESRLFLSENQQATFIEAVNLCYKMYQQTSDIRFALKAFELTEKSKSASFLAAVKDSRAKQFGGIPDSLISREEVLKINIANYKQMLHEENQAETPDSAKVALYNSKIFGYSEKYSQLVRYLEENYPKYYAFKYSDNVITLDEIRKRIKNRDAIVEYMIDMPDEQSAQGKMFRFVITSNYFGFDKINIDPSFPDKIEYLYQFLTNSHYQFTGKKEYLRYLRVGHGLYEDLLGTVRKQIEGKNLIVIPDDKLSYIPFDALLYQQGDTATMSFRTLPYLIRKHSVSYTYSSTLLFDYFKQRKTASKGLLAFAPGYENDNRDYSVVAEYRAGLLPLQQVEKEVEYVSHFVKGDVFRDSAAQESRFKQLAGDYDVLHLAMHTLMNDTLPMYSKLAFSKPLPDSADDGWLNTSEIYNMQLKARMAVLSACNTGTGKMQKGEGVMSLARGFLYAGCSSIIMTLWEVEDESGADIMRNFYKFLSSGKDKDDALRLAKLEHISQADPLKAHPHFWLGYVAVGNTSPLYFNKDYYFIAIVLLVLAGIGGDQYRRRRRRRLNR